MKTLFDLINKSNPIPKTVVKELKNLIKIEKFSAHHKIIKIGDNTNDLYFLLDGIARTYIILKNGIEYNSHLHFKNCYISSFDAMVNNKKSNISIECLTNCKVAKLSYKHLINFANIYTELNIAYINSIEELIIQSEKRSSEFATLTATERYLALKERVPNIDNLISQKNIASHIGITPVQLSRLKKKLLLQ